MKGTTTQQMREAPYKSVYVWADTNIRHGIILAKELGREDLYIVRPSWLTGTGFMGMVITSIVVDHGARLTMEQYDGLAEILLRIGR